MDFVDFFSGIGGIRQGCERAGMSCVGWCEFDKFAQRSYRAMYDTKGEWFASDIRAVSPYEPPKADLWTFGFPCQDVSIAGKRAGIQNGERSGLFYQIMRLLAGMREEDRPRWLLVENVENLLRIGNGFDFLRVLAEMVRLGYRVEWEVLNSKDFGVPQSRKRVFIIGHLGRERVREIFPIVGANSKNPGKIKEITGGLPMGERIYSSTGIGRTITAGGGGLGARTGLYAVRFRWPIRGEMRKEYGYIEPREIASTITAKHADDWTSDSSMGVLDCSCFTPKRLNPRGHARRIKSPDEPAYTLTTTDRHGIVHIERSRQDADGALEAIVRVRVLTPRECWRLQGFNDEYFDKAKSAGVSDSQLYRQAGNAVTVNVAEAIARKIMEVEQEEIVRSDEDTYKQMEENDVVRKTLGEEEE